MRHATNVGAAVEPDDHVAEIAEGYEIAPGAAAERRGSTTTSAGFTFRFDRQSSSAWMPSG